MVISPKIVKTQSAEPPKEGAITSFLPKKCSLFCITFSLGPPGQSLISEGNCQGVISNSEKVELPYCQPMGTS
jgi:hypothetical protein